MIAGTSDMEKLAHAFVLAVAAELERRTLVPQLKYEEWRAGLLKAPRYIPTSWPVGLTAADGD